MTPERWQQVKGVLASALEREDTSDRTAFLSDVAPGMPSSSAKCSRSSISRRMNSIPVRRRSVW